MPGTPAMLDIGLTVFVHVWLEKEALQLDSGAIR